MEKERKAEKKGKEKKRRGIERSNLASPKKIKEVNRTMPALFLVNAETLRKVTLNP